METFEQLLPDIKRLFWSKARFNCAMANYEEEILQGAYIVYDSCVRNFNPAFGRTFKDYMLSCFVSFARQYAYEQSLPNYLELKEEIDVMASNSEWAQQTIELIELLDKLSEREKSVVTAISGMLGGKPSTLTEWGQMHGLSRARASQIMGKARNKLQKLLKEA